MTTVDPEAVVHRPHLLGLREEGRRRACGQRAKAYGLEDQIGRIEIPTEEVVEMKAGKKVQTATRFFPGYILVEIETEESPDGRKIPDTTWHLVQATPRR